MKLRRTELDRVRHAQIFEIGRVIGLTHEKARAFAGEWFGVTERTIDDSYERVRKEPHTRYFLSRACEQYVENADRSLVSERWVALLKKYEPYRPHPGFSDDGRYRM